MKRPVLCLVCSLLCCPGTPLAAAASESLPPASAESAPAPARVCLWEDGGQKLARNDVSGAIASLESALHRPQAARESADGYRLLTVAYMQAGRDAQAAQTAQNALTLLPTANPNRAVIALLLGKAYYSDFAQGYEALSARATAIPNMRQLVISMATHEYHEPDGTIIVEQGDVFAQSDYQSLRADVKARLMSLQKTLDAAEAAYRDALAYDPHLPGIHDGLGLILEAKGFPLQARSEFAAERHEHGVSGTVLMHLGKLENAEGDTDSAISILRHAVRLAPQMHGAYDALAALYDSGHDTERARWAKGMGALVQGNVKGARDAFGSGPPATEELCRGMAALALAQKKSGDARALLARALSLIRAARKHGT